MTVAVGHPAPPFSRTDQDGRQVVVGPDQEGVVVVYFYPKDETYGCTAEACGFRDEYAVFDDVGARVVGISPDSDESHRSFARNHNLPFSLVSDHDGRLRELFDVPKTMGLLPGRVTFVIDAGGVVRHVFNSQLRARKHVDEAVKLVRELGAGGAR
jgi:peroxiredoxin Q/BCP